MKASWFVLIAAAGCDKVLGLDEVGVSPNETTVYAHGLTRTVINDANHLPTTRDNDFPAATITGIVAVLDDGTRTPVQAGGPQMKPGSFFFNRLDHTQPYRLIVPSTTADTAPVEYQLSAGTLELFERSWGRSSLPQPPAEMSPGSGSFLQYSLTNTPISSASASAYIESTGLWTETVIATGAQSSMPASFDWANANSLYGPVFLLDGSSTIRDRAYFTLHDFGGTGYRIIVGYRFDDVEMRAGMPTMTGGELYKLPRDTCVHVDASLGKASQAVHDAGLGTPNAGWMIEALPIAEMGPELNFVVADGNSSPADVVFGVPFGGYGLLLAMNATVPHPILAPGAMFPDVRSDGSTHWISPQATSPSPANTCTTTSTLDAIVPVPTAPQIGGAPIDEDRTLEIDRTRASVPLTWTPNGGTVSELYRADLYKVIDFGGTTVLLHLVRWLTTNVTPEGMPVIDIAPSYMEAGATYVIEVTDLIGFSTARTGDFSTIDPKYAQGYAWSGLITVTK